MGKATTVDFEVLKLDLQVKGATVKQGGRGGRSQWREW